MSDISIGTFSSHNNWIEGEVMGLRPLGTFITYHLKKKNLYLSITAYAQ